MREESNDGLPEAVQRTQFQALDRVMAMASFDLDGVLRHANRNYLQLLGLPQDQALGRSHQSFCTAAQVHSGAHAALWSQLRAGQAHSGVVERCAAMAAVAGWKPPTRPCAMPRASSRRS